jgi:hypothetical protein
MTGSFTVRKVIDQGSLGFVLDGTVISGQLASGMEAHYDSIVIIIGEIIKRGSQGSELKRARKGQKIYLRPKLTVFDVLKAVEGKVLEFEDIRSVPVEKTGLVLKPV